MLSVLIYCRFMAMLALFVTEVQTQGTVSISTTSLSPQLGDTAFSLECNIVNFQPALNRALAWTKDGDLVSWNRDIHGVFNGQTRYIVIGVTTYHYLDFFQVASTHGGTYKCLIADGQPSSYTEVASAEVIVQVPYFPPEPYPNCSPNVPTIAVVGTEVTLSCTSLPGYPDEVTLILQRGGQALTAGGTVSGNMKELQTSYTITSADSGMPFACTMMGTGIYSTMSRTCNIGPLEVVQGLPRILPSILTKSEGQHAIFTCELSSSGTIAWYTEPATQSSRSTSNGMTFTLLNVQQLSDNDKIVVCMATIGGAVVEDRAHLTVNSFVPPLTMAPTTNPRTSMKATGLIVPVETNPPSMIMNIATQTTDMRSDPANGQTSINIVSSGMDITEDFVTQSINTGQGQGSATLQVVVIALAISTSLLLCIVLVVTGIIALKIYRNRQNNHDNTSQDHTSNEKSADHYEDLQRDAGKDNRAYMWLNHRSEAVTDDHEYADHIELQTPFEDAVHQYGVPKERANENTAQCEVPKYIEITG